MSRLNLKKLEESLQGILQKEKDNFSITYIGNGIYKIQGFGYANEKFVEQLYSNMTNLECYG